MWAVTLWAVCYVLFFLVCIPLLMFKNRYFALLVPIAYEQYSLVLQFWESVATQEFAMMAILVTFHAVPCLAFYLFNVDPADLVMVPVLLFSLGIVITFAVSGSSLGCSAPAAYSSNISFIAGNIMWRGYVYMFVVLVLLPLIFLLRLKFISAYTGSPAIYRNLIVSGFCTSTLTGVFPWLADDYLCKDEVSILSIIYLPSCSTFNDDLHMGGFFGGISMCAIGSAFLLRSALQPHVNKLDEVVELSSRRSHKRINFVIGVIIVLALLLVCLFIEFGILFSLRPQLSAPMLCTKYKVENDCQGSSIPKEMFDSINATGQGWPCVWNATQPISTLLSQCTDPTCRDDGRLYQNAAGVACEYFVICCWLYIVCLTILVLEELEKPDSDVFGKYEDLPVREAFAP
ncbi:unnamed protein product [Polarella glacialis]|uniref:Uncharacterized protein n=2 Tax=Polarella glacialis TaxID=89957 RepID=A0A813LTJ3_POLGL|nr:unnamed protein product [Polarella glacialis]